MAEVLVRPRPEGLSLPVILSLGLHGLIVGLVVAMPHLQGRRFMQVPVTYVNLVSAAPGGGSAPARPGPAAVTAPPAPSPPPAETSAKRAPAARPVPPPRPVHEELSLPGRRKAPARPREPEAPLTPVVPAAPAPARPAPAPAPLAAAPAGPPAVPGPPATAERGGGPGGGADVGIEGPSGAGGSALSVYFALLQGKLVPIWETNQPRDQAGTSREAYVGVTIFRDGSFRDVTVVQSSGDRRFDQAALRSVYEGKQFPPFNTGVMEKSIAVRLRFFVLEGTRG